jgi:hypothetical protein
MNHWLRGRTMQPSSGGAFLERLRAARSNIKPFDPWTDALQKIRGETGSDGVDRIATEAVFDVLDLPRFQRTPEAGKRIKTIMLELGWVPVRARHVTSRGRAARVRGYTIVFTFYMCAWAPRKTGRVPPPPCPDTPGVHPAPMPRLATAGWSNPSEQRARTGRSQFVSDAQSVWLGARTECPHRRCAPEGWQHLRG